MATTPAAACLHTGERRTHGIDTQPHAPTPLPSESLEGLPKHAHRPGDSFNSRHREGLPDARAGENA